MGLEKKDLGEREPLTRPFPELAGPNGTYSWSCRMRKTFILRGKVSICMFIVYQ